MGGALKRAFAQRDQAIALAGAGIVLLIAAALPIVALVVEALGAGAASLAVLSSPRIWVLLVQSVGIATAVTLVAASVGIPLGVLIGRTDVPAPRLLWLLHASCMSLPPFLLALGWFHLLGREGFIGSEHSSAFLFSIPGLIAVLGLTFSPVVTSLVAQGTMGVDASLEEAARASAHSLRVLLRILLPATRPAVVLALIVVFSLALSELGVVTFLRADSFSAALFSRLGGIDFAPGEAFALVLPLFPIALALLWLERRFSSRRAFTVLGVRGAARARLPLGRARLPAAVGAWLVALVSIAPVLALLFRATGSGGSVRIVLQYAAQAPWNSVAVAVSSASVILCLGIVIGHATARALPGATLLDSLAVLAFVTPASVLGVALIAIWNRPGTGFVYTTVAILVLGCVARYAILGIRVVASTVAQTPSHLEEAAATAGACYLRRLLHIVVPVRARGVMFAWLLALVFCLRDLETAVLFYPPGREPLTVRIFTLEANGPEAVVAGLAVLHVLLTAFCILMGTALIYSWKRP